MKIIHLPFCFDPDPMGGTEIYVEALARELTKLGIENLIAAPASQNQTYTYNNLVVKRFAISSDIQNLKEIYGEGDKQGAKEFGKILDQEKPDLVHLHAFTRGASLRIVRECKSRGIPVIFTYHTPTVSCPRGTLLHWGQTVCDGEIEISKCTACVLQSLGLPKIIAQITANLPPLISKAITQTNFKGGAWTALQMRELVNSRSQAFYDLTTEVDHVIAVCDWVKNILQINQVPNEKITVIRQGLCQEISTTPSLAKIDNIKQPLRLIFFGRIDPTKGIDVIVNALATTPSLNISLDIYGVSQSQSITNYEKVLKTQVLHDPRISLKPPVSANQVVETMKQYDVLVVPSQWLETGPMVILEAFAAQIPVIGSNLGGIAELVTDGVNGLLVEASSTNSWVKAIKNLSDNRDIVTQLRENIKCPATMEFVAKKMNVVYDNFIAK